MKLIFHFWMLEWLKSFPDNRGRTFQGRKRKKKTHHIPAVPTWRPCQLSTCACEGKTYPVNHFRQVLWLFVSIIQQTVYINSTPFGEKAWLQLAKWKASFLLDLVFCESCPSRPLYRQAVVLLSGTWNHTVCSSLCWLADHLTWLIRFAVFISLLFFVKYLNMCKYKRKSTKHTNLMRSFKASLSMLQIFSFQTITAPTEATGHIHQDCSAQRPRR